MDRPHRTVTLYTRPGCHLCEQAEDLLETLGRQWTFRLVKVNILEDPLIYERYKWTIPVVAIQDGPTLAAPIDEHTLLVALAARDLSPAF